ncbi:putative F-box protein At4g38870 isoform X3 [Brassica napus]|uniref:putative F-box protein At4g38870 isoform X3 n=1 Tax=Brassica napus TaxID=3708 RepID=UPI0006AB3C01|nr:putative F-box protein At4g38870 isoform X3 [Brassica napus]
MEILKRFPVKTLARLTCVSTIRRQEFNKLWSSSNQQRRSSSSNTLIFAFKRDKGYGQDCFFFSSLQTKNPLEASVTATYLTAHPGDFSAPPSVHGLICYGPPSEIQPYHETVHYSPQVRFSEEVLVPLLGVRSHPHYSPESLHICIDGVLYYGACFGTGTTTSGVMSFDVRSEMFDVIRVPQGRARKFTCMTRYNGEFVLAPKELQESTFYVLYYDPKKKRVRKVDVEGITEHEELPLWDKDWKLRTMSIFPGQVL